MLRWSTIDPGDLDILGFGQEFQEIKAADQQLSETIHFFTEVREFVRERADLERDFARKLEALARKYAGKRSKTEKRSSGFFGGGSGGGSNAVGGGSPSSPVPPTGSDEESGTSTLQKSWSTLLHETENTAKTHLNLSDALSHDICERLKNLSSKKDDARKKHITFTQRLQTERDKIYDEKDKAKHKYDAACDAVEVAKQKHNRAPDDRTAGKLKRSWHQEIVDLQNHKNMYIVTLAVANACKHKYYAQDVPEVLSHMQTLLQATHQGLKQILTDYVNLDLTSLTRLTQHVAKSRASVEAIDPERDVEVWKSGRGGVEKIKGAETGEFEFVACGLWRDDDKMASDTYAHTFLFNKLQKIRKRLAVVEEEIAFKRKALEGTRTLWEAYVKDPKCGDADDVNEGMLETMRDLVVLEGLKKKYETKVSCVVGVIGEPSPEDKPHALRGTSFTIPTTCDYCYQTIWGVAKAGLTCKECGYNAHVKCELKIPPRCSGKKGVVVRPVVGSVGVPDLTGTGMGAAMSSTPVERRSTSPTTSVASSRAGSRDSMISVASSAISHRQSMLEPGSLAFVLYDYAPAASATDEVAVLEGNTVKVLEKDDGSGWTTVQVGDRKGVVPTTYIEAAPPIFSGLVGVGEAAAAAEGGVKEGAQVEGEEVKKGDEGVEMVARYEYEATGSDELSMKIGQVLRVLEEDDGSGWVMASDGSKEGLVPTSYLQSKE
ncbi:hypothetical protein HDV00_009334 [Rhizophlyctis rosea]|nr:hypothetical protein HDV00_009334 [Rhizophlyctis rosea]